MNKKLYWKNRIPFLLTNFICMIALAIFLFTCGNNFSSVCLILIVWGLILIFGMGITYLKRKRQMQILLTLIDKFPERYLISEVMEKLERAEDQVYYHLIKSSGKSMLEQIGKVVRERMEYKEYIEQWIHEIKTPITAIKLFCENNRSELTKEILTELEKTNHFTEQALYYARSEYAEKDYSVSEICLYNVIHKAIADNKHLLLQNNVRIEVTNANCTVFSDDKWIRFILNQFIVNTVKYKTSQPKINFNVRQCGDKIILEVKDNGIGIPECDLPRIFEKGFTGKNGRITKNLTGIGLYLCKKLCDKLGISIHANSNEDGTTICLIFYINYFIQEVQD